MLLPLPVKYRKHHDRPLRRKYKKPAPTGLSITKVASAGPVHELMIFFPEDVVWDGVGVPAAFRAMNSEGVMEPCVAVSAIYPGGVLQVEFSGTVGQGVAWELDGPMAGISPEVAWPQSGVVE